MTAARRGHAPPSPIRGSCIDLARPHRCYRVCSRARSSAGERLLHTQEVVGSNPAAPTTCSGPRACPLWDLAVSDALPPEAGIEAGAAVDRVRSGSAGHLVVARSG